jgi:hypothetical protein
MPCITQSLNHNTPPSSTASACQTTHLRIIVTDLHYRQEHLNMNMAISQGQISFILERSNKLAFQNVQKQSIGGPFFKAYTSISDPYDHMKHSNGPWEIRVPRQIAVRNIDKSWWSLYSHDKENRTQNDIGRKGRMRALNSFFFNIRGLWTLALKAPANHQPKDEDQKSNPTTHHQLKPQVLKPHLAPQLSAMPMEVVGLKQI